MFGLKESEDELFAEYLLHKYNTDQSELDRFYTVWDLLLEKKLFLEFPEQFALYTIIKFHYHLEVSVILTNILKIA